MKENGKSYQLILCRGKMIFTGVSLLLNLVGGNATDTIVNSLSGSSNPNPSQSASFVQTSVNLELNGDPYKHSLTLDPRGNYRLEWEVDWEEEKIYFNVTVVTKGYVGFGLSKKGKMSGSDIVIGGVDRNGKPYFSDRHAVNNQQPIPDKSQDWTLHEAWERGGLTSLSFSRPFDTCDSELDLPIDENLLSVIWAYGENDDVGKYHFGNRGVYDLYLLDPSITPQSLLDIYQQDESSINPSVFQMRQTITVPEQDTLYWCSFHRTPTTTKHHIIGFDTEFPTDRDCSNVHHLLLHRCQASPGSPAFQTLEQASLNGGGECYLGDNVGPSGFTFCREAMTGWGVGGSAVFFPEHVGLSMSESGPEFYMLQIHYDNPNLIPNLTVSASFELYYTSNLRRNDAGMLLIGSRIPGAVNLAVPPSSIEHTINGHCPSGCTQRMFPPEGIKIFATVLHTHLTGREAILRHFRNRTELPWIISDDNYNFNYQQVRLFSEERRVLPGDQLIQQCVYDTTLRNGTVVTGGYSTREEMCVAFVYYYTRVPGLVSCLSEIRDEGYRNLLGIRNITFDSNRRETIVTNPPQYNGLSVSNYLTNYIDQWDLKLREEVQRQHFFQPQIAICATRSTSTSTTTVPSQIIGIRDQFVRQQRQRRPPPGILGDELSNGRRGSTGFLAKLPYDFNSGTGITSNSQQQTQTSVANEEESRFPSLVAEYKPESKCGSRYYEQSGTAKGRKNDKVDFKSYRNFEYGDFDENRNLGNNHNHFGYDNVW